MSDFNLATAEKPELKAYAINELGLNLSLTMNDDTMRQKISDKCLELGIEAPTARIDVKGSKGKHKYYYVNIAKQTVQGDGGVGAAPVFVGFQGTGYMIPRGIKVAIPEPLIEILNNAMQDIVTQDPDSGEVLHEDMMTHPFQVLGEAA